MPREATPPPIWTAGSYALLGHILSPWKGPASVDGLRAAFLAGTPDWNTLLYRANRELCTPMLYMRLHRDGLVDALPDELNEYLHLLHEANAERNAQLHAALLEILRAFDARGIGAILLKGATTFFDRLYATPGARMMGDLDILIEEDAADTARQLLTALGYRFEGPHPAGGYHRFPDNRHHHLPRAYRAPVAVELHIRIARRQGGRALPTDAVWDGKTAVVADGARAQLPSPTHRLLHNAVHALLPRCEFLRSDVSLANLVEFSCLAHRYGPEVDWREWYARGAGAGLATELISYAALSAAVTGQPYPLPGRPPLWARLHARRIAAMTAYDGRPPQGAVRLAARAYFRFMRPAWLWHNHFYRPGTRYIPQRAGDLLKYLLKAPLRRHPSSAHADRAAM